MRRRPLAAVGLAAALLLSACSGDDPEPRFEEDSSSAAATTSAGEVTSEPSQSEPTLSPEETVRAWVEGYNSALRTGDTSDADALTTQCKTCEWQVEPIAAVHEDGGSFRGGAWTVVSTKETSSADARAAVTAAIKVAEGTTIPSRGASPVAYEVEKNILQFRLRQVGNSWRIAFIGYVT